MQFKKPRLAPLVLALASGFALSAAPLPLAVVLLGAAAPVVAQDDRETERENERENESDRESELDNERETEREQSHGDVGLDTEPDEVLAIDLGDRARVGARKLGFRVIEDYKLRGLGFRLTQLSTPGGIPPQLALQRLRKADPEGVYDLNPSYAEAGSACEGIRCDAQKMIGWPQDGCAAEVRIGMVDTAVERSSPALLGDRLQQRHFGNSGATPAGAEHGTEVATILLGNVSAGFAGLLPRALLFAANVFDYERARGESTSAVTVARGVDWLLTQQPAVINVAIAGPDNLVLHETVRRVVQRGIPLVAAAGNLGPSGPPRYPAAYAEAIAVTAVDRDGRVYERANQGDYIDVAAPGVHVWSAGADGRGRFVDGTSFATPYVAAEVALLRLAQPQRAPAEWKAQLRASARGVDAPVLHSRGCSSALPLAATVPASNGAAHR